MKIFDLNGWLDFNSILGSLHKYPFIFIYGGRGIGKTYGAIKYMIEHNLHFAYIRTTKTQIDECKHESVNPFRKICADTGTDYRIKGGSIIRNGPNGTETVGIAAALTTIGNIRGIDASDCDVIIYDEFIPTKGERWVSDQGALLESAYETIARNRELEGKQPLKCICLANSNMLVNPVFMGLNLVSLAEKLQKSRNSYLLLPDRGIALFAIKESPITERKVNTALYRMNPESEHSKIALENEFEDMDYSNVKSLSLIEFNPYVTIGELTIYKHKSKKLYYVSFHRSGSCPSFTTDSIGRKQYKAQYGSTWWALSARNMIFESVYAKQFYINLHTRN